MRKQERFCAEKIKGPDKVVEYMLNALQKSEYEKYFLYLDLEKLLIKSESKRERYNRMLESERASMIKEYRNYLSSAYADRLQNS